MQQLSRKPVESGVWSLDPPPSPKGRIRYVRIMYTDHLSLTTEAFQETIWIPQSSLVTIYLLKASQPAKLKTLLSASLLFWSPRLARM
jgi:hypothetical protein